MVKDKLNISYDTEVDIQFEPLQMKVFHLTSESLELLARDIEDRHSLSRWMSSSLSVLAALLLECAVINDIREFEPVSQKVMIVVLIVVFFAALISTVKWLLNRKPLEAIIKGRTKEAKISDNS